MGKLEDNKKIKREAILDAAFLLFTTKRADQDLGG